MRLKHITFDGKQIPLSNLVVIVGSNGVGKTTFLRDLHEQFKNSTSASSHRSQDTKWRNLLEGSFLHSTKSEWSEWANNLQEITGHTQNNQVAFAIGEYLSHEGRSDFLWQDEVERLIEYLKTNNPPDLDYLEQQFGRAFKSQHSHLLSVETRFYVAKQSGGQLSKKNINDLKPAPFLAMHPRILRRVNHSLGILFGKQLHVEPHDYPQYFIYVAAKGTKSPTRTSFTTDGVLKSQEVYEKWQQTENVTSLNNEGHGVRAATEILYALENERKRVLFIDEPELHLYPSTKYTLGRIISSYSSSRKQVILVTHDTEILRGLIHGPSDATIIRINPDRTLSSIMSSEVKKSYSADILQAAFQDSVLIVEGIDDKYVYGKALSEKHLADDISLQVVSMYGKDSLSIPIRFYNQISVKHAVIADFDAVLSDKKGVKHITLILRAQNKPPNEISRIESQIDSVRNVVAERYNAKKGLNSAGLTSNEKLLIKDLIGSLKMHGIFIVPTGELHDWVKFPEKKPPEEIYSRYKARSNSTYKSLTDFLGEIVQYLK